MSSRDFVGVRVPEQVKEAYESRILEERPCIRPYAGVFLEEELRKGLNMDGELSVFRTLKDLVPNDEKNKNSGVPTLVGGETVVNYRIDPDVRAELKSASVRGIRSMGELVALAMYNYSIGEGYEDKIKRLAEKLNGLGASERKELAIAEYLKEHHSGGGGYVSFKVEDFDKAAREAAGLKTARNARKQYLRDVLDRLNLKPTRSGNFLPEDSDALRDISGLPRECLTDSEKQRLDNKQ